MKKPSAALWMLVLLLSLGGTAALIARVRSPAPVSLPTAAPTETPIPPALVVAPTRFLPTVAPGANAGANATPPPAVPTIQPLAPSTLDAASTLGASSAAADPPPPAPRVFQASGEFVPSRAMLASYCPQFGSPTSMRIYDWNTGTTLNLSDEAIARIPLGWNASTSLWRGYGSARPFAVPDDTVERWRITLYLSDGSERWIQVSESAQTPRVNYVYAYQTTTPFAGKNGDHFGYHPCRAFTLRTVEMQAFLTSVGQYQDVVRYPALIGGDDARWTRVILSPVAAAADLRSIPSTDYNDPISRIDHPVTVWYAFDPAWGQWAQVKLGVVQGWIDTAKATIAPAP